jgi:hypothetical protein
MKPCYLPFSPALNQCPELASLAILDVALSAVEYALCAASPEITCGTFDGAPRRSTVARANALILQARRLAACVAAYRDAVERDVRRIDRQRQQRTF